MKVLYVDNDSYIRDLEDKKHIAMVIFKYLCKNLCEIYIIVEAEII